MEAALPLRRLNFAAVDQMSQQQTAGSSSSSLGKHGQLTRFLAVDQTVNEDSRQLHHRRITTPDR